MSDRKSVEQALSQDKLKATVSSIGNGSTETPLAKSPKQNYNDFRGEVDKPFNQRREVLVGRGGSKKKPRKYHNTAEEMARLRAIAVSTGAKFVNAHGLRLGESYAGVQALIDLGPNEWHSLKNVREKMKSIMQAMPEKTHKQADGKATHVDAWSAFYDKTSRKGAENPKDGDGRIEQNFRVLQRLPSVKKGEKNPYGLKLSQFGHCIDIEKKEMAPGIYLPFFRLNTTWTPDDTGMSIKPVFINPFTKRRGRPKGVKNKPKALPIEISVPVEDSGEISSSNEIDDVIEPSVQQQIAALMDEDDGKLVIPDAQHEDFE